MDQNPIPIIALDGTVASGKGTIAYRLSQYFGFNYLNSGAIYRLIAYTALKEGIALSDTPKVIEIAHHIRPTFEGKKVILDGTDLWPIISTQEYGNHASIISVVPEIRHAIHEIQRNMITLPGLVAEGRDMCNNVFKDARVKLYLDGTPEVRAERRFKDEEVVKSGKSYDQVLEEVHARDVRDKDPKKIVGRLYPAEDALIVDTTNLDIQGVLDVCINWCKEKGVVKKEEN